MCGAVLWRKKRLLAGNRTTTTWIGKGLTFRKPHLRKSSRSMKTAWRTEVIGHEELFIQLHDHLPKELIYERELLICRL